MARTIEELQVVITADDKQAQKGLKNTEKTTENLGKKFLSLGKLVAGTAVAGAIVGALRNIAKESEKAFQIQEKAVVGVNAALKSTGQFTEQASQEIQDYASSLQEVTTVGDETTLSLIQTALNMGLTADQAKEAAKQAIGASEAFGLNLDTALRASANATLGNFEAFQRYLPALKNAETEAEKAAIVQEQLADAFDIATANAQTSIGIQTQLANNVGDLQETVGGLISRGLTPWRSNLSKLVVDINKSIQAQILQNRVASGQATILEKLVNKQNEQIDLQKQIEQAKANIEAATNRENSAYESQFRQLQNLDEVVNTALVQAQETLRSLESEKTAIDRQVEAISREVAAENERTQAAIEAATAIGELTEETDENTESTEKNSEAVFTNVRFLEAQQAQLTYASRAFTEASEDADEYAEALERVEISALNLANVGLSALASGFEDIGTQLVEGGLSAASFGKLLLGVVADTLRALGSQLSALAAVRLLFGDVAGAATGFGASAAAFLAAGVVEGAAGALAEGGSFTTNGPTPLLVGDNPGGQERVTVEPVSSNGANVSSNGNGGTMRVVIDFGGGKMLTGFVQDDIDNNRLRSRQGGSL